MQFFDVGMVAGFRQHSCDDAALTGHLHTFVDTKLLDPGDRSAFFRR